MEWTTAVQALAGLVDGDQDAAIEAILTAMSAYDGGIGNECAQGDWVKEGTWSGNETPDQIRVEWEAYIASDEDAE